MSEQWSWRGLTSKTRMTSKSSMPTIMAIVNVTPDSFSDGGQHADVESACAFARSCREDGAGILDIGGESTRPGATPVAVELQIARTRPVIERFGDAVHNLDRHDQSRCC